MDRYDDQEIYCRKLGHRLGFKYCRTVKEGIPCQKIMDCWFENISIEEYINEFYSEEELKEIFSPPVNKMASLIDLIEKAKKCN